MSLRRFANQYIVAEEVIERGPSVPIIASTVEELLRGIDRHKGNGDEIFWRSLRLTVEPTADGLEFKATVDVNVNDVVEALTAVALAQHERKKRALRDEP